MNYQQDELKVSSQSEVTSLQAPASLSSSIHKKSPSPSLCIDKDEFNNAIISMKASVEHVGSTSSQIGPMLNRGKQVRFPTYEDKEEKEKSSSTMTTILKKFKSVPSPSTIQKKIAKDPSYERYRPTNSKKVFDDPSELKITEELEKVKEMVRKGQNTEKLVSRVFPPDVYKQLSLGTTVKPQSYKNVTIFLSNIVGYMNLVSELDPMRVNGTFFN